MKISEVMTRNVQTTTPERSLREVASLMESIDSGAILVHEGDRLVGMVTDRDIALRGVAAGLGGETPVRQIMSGDVRYCFEDEDVQHVAANMAQIQLRRLPVLNREKRLVGVVSLGNIVASRSEHASATVLQGVARAH
ncbi:CBS domain-containing protein [Pseudomonas sp. JS3066]|jgi:CBS domain-containing protein|uniref:CBS domain-containing protein n=1 Tax=unclassified Pseudomonas TaxID=196821 RepID=UPI000EAA45E3|nr:MULTISPECIES: CBS domain-containing protein [unclassified Pseudomonas]AYF86735.1 CBS domain-containing protein [Pseudomonas sp. DY-1]MDH4653636.1 CBS domain-containing protein [Pseudomonas sp. BN606]MRK22017.1 CBS domain-containing protein [Pseudomonas sp. JG-B]WVK95795.1 CBS domain-containing protein [Pseudomonas sp. JS3066]